MIGGLRRRALPRDALKRDLANFFLHDLEHNGKLCVAGEAICGLQRMPDA
jgi:hypothetical protein